METKTNNQNQNTPKTPNTTKTEPSAEDKALAKLVRTTVLDFTHDMEKLCQENGLSFGIGVWVEDPVDRGDTPDKTIKFSWGNCNARTLLEHKIVDISLMLRDGIKECAYQEVAILCMMAEHLIGSTCKMVMAQLKEKMKTDDKTKSETKEN